MCIRDSYYCQSQEYKSTIDALSNGSTRKNLNANQFGRIEIPLYSIETQQHIVDIQEKGNLLCY